jgi:hypothetical protein
MSMREAIHIPEDDLIQYALGTLPEIQLGTLTAHISMCNQCRDELMRTQVDLASYAAIQPLSELPTGARERFMAQIAGGATESKFAQMATNSRIFRATKAFKEWLETPMPLKILSGALAAAMLFLAYDDAGHIHQIRQLLPEMKRFENATAELDELKEFLRGGNVQQVSLHDRPVVNKSPEGHAIYAPATGRLIFTATGMGAPPAGKAYELWLLPASGAAPIPAGVFTPDIQGNAAVIFPKIPVNVQAGGFGVTLEDAAGSQKPTSPILLSGQ